MAWQDELQTTLENLCKLRNAFIDEQLSGNLKPTYNVQGHMFDWNEYARWLDESIDKCMKQLAQGEPFEYVTAGR